MKKGNWKKIMSILAATIGTTFVITSLVAKKEIGKSQYKDESNQMNPLEGKKVVFIENDDEIENADGVRGHLEAIGDSDYKVGFYEKYIKRGFDIVLSFGGLVVLSPILGAIALAIKIDNPGPVLFTQKRMGQNKKYFKLHKFRSMKMCTPHDVPTHQLENPEQYITRVGKFLRSHSLDELPQIWDIFIGNMSVIGPRPGLWNQDILTAERDKYNANDVKPGLTGWAQINGRDELEIPVKAKLDGEYVKHMGLIMDDGIRPMVDESVYRSMAVNKNALVIAISQSGETADTLAALRLAKEKGMATLAIVNVVGSSIAREADKVFYTLAGPEISVATTKAYSAQLAAMYCIAVEFAFVRGKITEEQYAYYISELLTIAPKINKILEDKERLQWFAAKYAGAHDVFFVGRGIDYAVSLEGSLKLKEISYIHSEAYAAGELKHGTISLIEPGTLVIGVLTQSKLYEKTMSNMVECRSRGAYLLGLTTYGKYEIEETVDFAVYVPRIDEYFAGSLAVVPLQLLGYYVSVAKGLDVDKPRNLAKSVTVE